MEEQQEVSSDVLGVDEGYKRDRKESIRVPRKKVKSVSKTPVGSTRVKRKRTPVSQTKKENTQEEDKRVTKRPKREETRNTENSGNKYSCEEKKPRRFKTDIHPSNIIFDNENGSSKSTRRSSRIHKKQNEKSPVPNSKTSSTINRKSPKVGTKKNKSVGTSQDTKNNTESERITTKVDKRTKKQESTENTSNEQIQGDVHKEPQETDNKQEDKEIVRIELPVQSEDDGVEQEDSDREDLKERTNENHLQVDSNAQDSSEEESEDENLTRYLQDHSYYKKFLDTECSSNETSTLRKDANPLEKKKNEIVNVMQPEVSYFCLSVLQPETSNNLKTPQILLKFKLNKKIRNACRRANPIGNFGMLYTRKSADKFFVFIKAYTKPGEIMTKRIQFECINLTRLYGGDINLWGAILRDYFVEKDGIRYRYEEKEKTGDDYEDKEKNGILNKLLKELLKEKLNGICEPYDCISSQISSITQFDRMYKFHEQQFDIFMKNKQPNSVFHSTWKHKMIIPYIKSGKQKDNEKNVKEDISYMKKNDIIDLIFHKGAFFSEKDEKTLSVIDDVINPLIQFKELYDCFTNDRETYKEVKKLAVHLGISSFVYNITLLSDFEHTDTKRFIYLFRYYKDVNILDFFIKRKHNRENKDKREKWCIFKEHPITKVLEHIKELMRKTRRILEYSEIDDKRLKIFKDIRRDLLEYITFIVFGNDMSQTKKDDKTYDCLGINEEEVGKDFFNIIIKQDGSVIREVIDIIESHSFFEDGITECYRKEMILNVYYCFLRYSKLEQNNPMSAGIKGRFLTREGYIYDSLFCIRKKNIQKTVLMPLIIHTQRFFYLKESKKKNTRTTKKNEICELLKEMISCLKNGKKEEREIELELQQKLDHLKAENKIKNLRKFPC